MGQTPCNTHGGPCYYDEPASRLTLAFVDGEIALLGRAAAQRLASRPLDTIDATPLSDDEEQALRAIVDEVLPQLLSPSGPEDAQRLAERTAELVTVLGAQAGVVVLATCYCPTATHTGKVYL